MTSSSCIWAGRFESYLVADLRRQVFSWRGSYFIFFRTQEEIYTNYNSLAKPVTRTTTLPDLQQEFCFPVKTRQTYENPYWRETIHLWDLWEKFLTESSCQSSHDYSSQYSVVESHLNVLWKWHSKYCITAEIKQTGHYFVTSQC